MIKVKSALVDQLSISLSNFLIIILAARMLVSEAVAKYSLAYSMFLLIFMVANALIYQHILATKREDLTISIINKYRSLNFLLIIIFLPLLYFGYILIMNKIGESSQHEIVLILVYVFINQSIDFERRILYYIDHSSIISPAYISFFILCMRVLLLVYLEPNNFLYFLFLIIIPGLPIVIYSLLKIRISIFFEKFPNFIVEKVKDGRWLILNIPVNWIWGQAPLYIISILLNLHSAGIFMAIRSVSNVGNIAMELIPTYFGARISKLFYEDKTVYIKYIMKILIGGSILWLLAFGLIITLGDLFLGYVLGEEYINFNELLVFFWVFTLLLFYSRVVSIHVRLTEMTYILPWSFFIGSIVMIFVAIIFPIEMSMNKIALSMLCGALSLLILQIYPFIKYRKVKS